MTLEILIVEDNPQHRQDAQTYFAEREGVVKVFYAETLREARVLVEKQTFDGIISDIFFPSGYQGEENQRIIEELYTKISPLLQECPYRERSVEATERWRKEQALPPSGVLVCEEALRRNTFFTLNTDTYHHGGATEPVRQWLVHNKSKRVIGGSEFFVETGRAKEVPGPERFVEIPGESKDWRAAYAQIVTQVIERDLPPEKMPEKYREFYHQGLSRMVRFRLLRPYEILHPEEMGDEEKKSLEQLGIDPARIIEEYKI